MAWHFVYFRIEYERVSHGEMAKRIYYRNERYTDNDIVREVGVLWEALPFDARHPLTIFGSEFMAK